MRKAYGKPSYFLLIFLTLLSLLLFYLAEKSQMPRKAAFYDEKIAAAEIAKKAQEIIKQELAKRGYVIDVQNDPNLTGLIGQQYSLITTDRGFIRDKLVAADPNNAAVMIELFHKANLQPGDLVAVTLTGAFPGMNIAVLAACKTMALKPVIITSVGASAWGANWEEFTWLDMESALVADGLWDYKSVAASIGGGNDHGRGLAPRGRELLEQAIARNGVELISSISDQNPTGSLDKNIERRIKIFDREKGGNKYRLAVNVGGGLAAIGSTQNGQLIPPGYNARLYERALPAEGAITILAERHIPVIHLLQIDDFARRYDLLTDATSLPAIGKGKVFVQERYSITTTIIYTVVLLVALWAAIRFDFRYYIYRNQHLFVRKSQS